MGDSTIEWTDKTWNPVRGCSRVSAGCENCYAERQAARFAGKGGRFEGFVRLSKKHGPRWTGRVELVPHKLGEPASWRKPQRIFVNSMSDLFHESMLFTQIAAVFGAMLRARQHTYQVLTKRPQVARAFQRWLVSTARAEGLSVAAFLMIADYSARDVVMTDADHRFVHESTRMGLPNEWWIGVSVEDQKTADERIPELLALEVLPTKRFVSYEPALGPIDFRYSAFNGADSFGRMPGLDWVIVGGESGPGARPFDVAWARNTIEQCGAAGVACFVKQLGADARNALGAPSVGVPIKHGKGGDPSEWPSDLRVREFPPSGTVHPWRGPEAGR